MARLNDPPVPAESIDALKRRFIRQNREIARVNSTQSLRIRNLETEISRLLTENISLREQVIAAQYEAERWRNAHHIRPEVLSVKDKLEKKLAEVSLLVQELGGLPDRAARRKSGLKRESDFEGQQARKLDDQDLKARQLSNGEKEAVEGRLPAILEDKQYPRKTLEPTEIRTLIDEAALGHASESPDLGPPPVSQFDVTESVAFDTTRTPKRTPVEELDAEDMLTLSRNLETRRKRRTSSLLQDMSTDVSESEKERQEPQPISAKSGAKRKLDVTELEEGENQKASQKDDFVFQRRPVVAVPPKKGSRFSRPTNWQPQQDTENVDVSPQKEMQLERKVLAPKNTNSPSKRRVQVSEKPFKEEEQVGRSIRVSRSRNEPESVDIRLPPKTPAATEDMFSPISTEPSVRNDSRAQEAAVLNSVEDVLNGSIGRGSRRARAAVSYAEPNLRDKMRRPGKELVGAVEGIHIQNRNSTKDDGGRSSNEDLGTKSATQIKSERVKDDEKWKTLPMANKIEEPASPLVEKDRKLDKERIRRRQIQAEVDNLINSDLDKAVDRLSIYDAPVSSPSEGTDITNKSVDHPSHQSSSSALKKHPSTTSSRRHSTNPSSLASNSSILTSRSSATTGAGLARPSSYISLSRPSSAIGSRRDSVISEGKENAAGLRRANSVAALTNKENQEAKDLDKDVVNEARNDRIGTRRRSMMV